jgi:hypothetical protein
VTSADYSPEPRSAGRLLPLEPIFQARNLNPDSRLCFVLMPLAVPRLEAIYQEFVRPAIEELGLTAVRANEIFSTSAIIEDIWRSIYNARVIVAELTGLNPNVFYELGVAHTVGREVIPISQASTVFDIGHIRHILYADTSGGLDELRQKLRGTLENVLKNT